MSAGQVQSMLQAWEDGRNASAGERGLILLRLAEPAKAEAALRTMSVGRRDTALLDLHERLLGPTARALADCPACGEQLELNIELATIRADPPEPAPERFVLHHGGATFAYRLPTAGDLAALGATAATPTRAARRLAQSCLLEPDATAFSPDDDAAEALETAIGEAVAEKDPQAVINLALDCPACAHHWLSPFDIVEFLWRWFDGFARGLLGEVHALASAYGWSEHDILSLSPTRRRHYLELIGA